ncbi:enoyl-CoA hydratase/isomerase family protein [Leucobacter sp. HY1910]
MPSVLYRVHEHVARISLNLPERRNMLDDDVEAELDAALERAQRDADVRCIILTGEGESFCAGWNLNLDVENMDSSVWEEWASSNDGAARRQKWWRCRKPVVAAVRGYCLGAGFELAQLSDFVVASEDAIFGETEIRYSLISYAHTIWLMGIRNAKEVMMLGEKFDAERARDYGLVNRVVSSEELEDAALELAKRLAKMPTETMQLMKYMITKSADVQGLSHMHDWGLDLFALSKVIHTPEKQEFAKIANESGMRAALAWTREEFGDDFDRRARRG